MGNDQTYSRKRSQPPKSHSNSFSLENLSSRHKQQANLPPAITPRRPSLQQINQSSSYSSSNANQIHGLNNNHEQTSEQSEFKFEKKRKLKNLSTKNDELRRELIKINSELMTQLKKKKYEVKKPIQNKSIQKGKESLKRELENVYKQINMYKKTIEQMKTEDPSQLSQLKLTELENSIAEKDFEIELALDELKAIKNVTSNQNVAIKKDESSQGVLNSLKKEIETLRSRIRAMINDDRARQKKYLDQHSYMMALQYKNRQIENQNEEQEKPASQQPQSPHKKQIQQFEKQIKILKLKHDEYHKKLNSLMSSNKGIKMENKMKKNKIEEIEKEIEGLRYRRDAYVKKIKDNLDVFVAKKDDEEEQQLSEFYSEEQEEYAAQEEQEKQKGTFDIEHLKSEQKPQKPEKPPNEESQNKMQVTEKEEPKKWKKMITRVVSKGAVMPEQKQFKSGIKIPRRDMRIVMMHIWMNKKKQITTIQPIYLMEGVVIEGRKSSRNHEDQYRVTYELQEHDYLKSILGIFGKSGFLQFLVLQSNNGKVSKVGRQRTDGSNFAIGVAKEETPIQIVGASTLDGLYWRINRLDVEVLVDMSGSSN